MDCVDDKLGVPEKKRPHNTKPENVKNSEWGAKSVSNKNYLPQALPSSVSGYYFPGGFQFKSNRQFISVQYFVIEGVISIRGGILLTAIFGNNAREVTHRVFSGAFKHHVF